MERSNHLLREVKLLEQDSHRFIKLCLAIKLDSFVNKTVCNKFKYYGISLESSYPKYVEECNLYSNILQNVFFSTFFRK